MPGENLLCRVSSIDRIECAHGGLNGEHNRVELSNFKMQVLPKEEARQNENKFLNKYFTVALHLINKIERKTNSDKNTGG